MIKLHKQSTMLAALALALGMSAGAMAQSTGASGAAGGGQGGGTTATSSTFQSWLNTHSGKKISRQAYLDEVGRP